MGTDSADPSHFLSVLEFICRSNVCSPPSQSSVCHAIRASHPRIGATIWAGDGSTSLLSCTEIDELATTFEFHRSICFFVIVGTEFAPCEHLLLVSSPLRVIPNLAYTMNARSCNVRGLTKKGRGYSERESRMLTNLSKSVPSQAMILRLSDLQYLRKPSEYCWSRFERLSRTNKENSLFKRALCVRLPPGYPRLRRIRD